MIVADFRLYIPPRCRTPVLFSGRKSGKCRERDISIFRHLLQPSYRYATLARLCRRFLLSFSRMGSGLRRTPDSRFSFLAYRYYFYPALSGPSAKQTFLLHIIAFRHPFDTGHSLYPGTLLSGCHCRDISLLSGFPPERMGISKDKPYS